MTLFVFTLFLLAGFSVFVAVRSKRMEKICHLQIAECGRFTDMLKTIPRYEDFSDLDARLVSEDIYRNITVYMESGTNRPSERDMTPHQVNLVRSADKILMFTDWVALPFWRRVLKMDRISWRGQGYVGRFNPES